MKLAGCILRDYILFKNGNHEPEKSAWPHFLTNFTAHGATALMIAWAATAGKHNAALWEWFKCCNIWT